VGARPRGPFSIAADVVAPVVDVLATAVGVETTVAEVVATPSEPVNEVGRPHPPSKTAKTKTAIDKANLTGFVSDRDLADVRRRIMPIWPLTPATAVKAH